MVEIETPRLGNHRYVAAIGAGAGEHANKRRREASETARLGMVVRTFIAWPGARA